MLLFAGTSAGGAGMQCYSWVSESCVHREIISILRVRFASWTPAVFILQIFMLRKCQLQVLANFKRKQQVVWFFWLLNANICDVPWSVTQVYSGIPLLRSRWDMYDFASWVVKAIETVNSFLCCLPQIHQEIIQGNHQHYFFLLLRKSLHNRHDRVMVPSRD